jgi:hypothetical protein
MGIWASNIGDFFVSTMVVKMGFSELEGNLVVDHGKKPSPVP